jgi:hypothetical protein
LITFNNGGKAMAIKRWQRITQNISSDEVLEYINKKYGATRPSKKFLLSAKRHKLVSNSIAKTGFERIFSELIPGLRSFDQPPFQNKIPQDRSVKSTQRASLAKTISGYAKKYGEMIYFDIGTESGSKRVSHLATMSFDLGLLVEHLDNTSISAEIEGKKLTKSMEKYISQFKQDYPPNYRLMLTNPVGLTYPQIEVKYPHVNIDPNVASNDMELYDPSSVFLKDNGESVSNGWIEIKQSNSRYIPLEVDIRETYRVLNPDYDWEALFSKPASEILKTNNSNMYLVNDVNFTYFTNYHLSYLNLIKVLKQDYEISNAKFLFNQKKTKIYIDLTGQYQSFEAIKKDADKTEDLYTNYLNSDLIKCEEISYLGKKVCVDNRQLDLPEHLDYMYIDGKFTLAFNKDTLIKRMKRRTFSGAIYKAGLKQAQDNLEYLKNIGNIDIENSEVRL